jgi:hypothetical protein
VVLSFIVTILAPQAQAQFSTGLLFSNNGKWNYSVASFVEGTIHRYYRCGTGIIPGTTGNTDVILYRTYDSSTARWSAIYQVLWPTLNSWEDGHGAGTCNPSVIKGQFVPGNGTTYSYAMYYVAQNDGKNNIGVAFSNDAFNWTNYTSNPIIYPLAYPNDPPNTYGAGAPSLINVNGVSNLYLFQFDDTVTHSLPSAMPYWWRTSNDGIHFGAASPISGAGTNGARVGFYPTDMGYDSSSNSYYATIVEGQRAGDREAYQFAFYKIPTTNLLSGQGAWSLLGSVDTNLTGQYLNVQPRSLRDIYGSVTPYLPPLNAYFGAGTNNPITWNVNWVTRNIRFNSMAFNRYYSPGANLHWVTTGYIGLGYNLEGTLGYLYLTPQTGTQPLYGCQASGTYFISLGSNCEGYQVLGLNGYIYSSPPTGLSTRALYRCLIVVNNIVDHFVSTDINCEGWKDEGRLGYAPTTRQ